MIPQEITDSLITFFTEHYSGNLKIVSAVSLSGGCINLYPLLIHLNLFGSGYLGQIESVVRKYWMWFQEFIIISGLRVVFTATAFLPELLKILIRKSGEFSSWTPPSFKKNLQKTVFHLWPGFIDHPTFHHDHLPTLHEKFPCRFCIASFYRFVPVIKQQFVEWNFHRAHFCTFTT